MGTPIANSFDLAGKWLIWDPEAENWDNQPPGDVKRSVRRSRSPRTKRKV